MIINTYINYTYDNLWAPIGRRGTVGITLFQPQTSSIITIINIDGK